MTAFALLGGIALYLLGLVAFRYRQQRTWNRNKLILAAVLLRADPGGDGDPGAGDAGDRDRAPRAAGRSVEHAGYDERRDELRARNTMTEAEAELVAGEEE